MASIDIHELIARRERELTTRESTENTSFPREQYKNKNIKQYKSLSRPDGEDNTGVKVSARPASWPEADASSSAAVTPSQDPLAGTSCQERDVKDLGPRELTSRWSGISVHHVRTRKGVKIGVTLQQAADVSSGRILPLTAELKRYERLREVKSNESDSDEFVAYLAGVKEQLQSDRCRSACVGRVHQRGARKAWLKNVLVTGFLEDEVVRRLYLYIEGEQFEISLNEEMSDRQKHTYHATGYHGRIVLKKSSPSIFDLPTVQYGA
jgi:hypothetical protein